MEDVLRVEAAAKRFAKRHRLTITGSCELDMLAWEGNTELARLWERCKCRALDLKVSASLKHPVVLAHGYVGTSGY